MVNYTKPEVEVEPAEETIQGHVKKLGKPDGVCNTPNNVSACVAYDIDE